MSGIGPDINEFFMQQWGQSTKSGSPSRGAQSAAPMSAVPMQLAGNWLTYCSAQTGENLRTVMAMGSCHDPAKAIELWTDYLNNSRQHFLDAAFGGSRAVTAKAVVMRELAAPRAPAMQESAVADEPARMSPTQEVPDQPETPGALATSEEPASPPDESVAPPAESVVEAEQAVETVRAPIMDEGQPPALLDAPEHGLADDLKKISGVGPSLEQKLNGLGIFHFSQIAALTPENIRWVDSHLSFRGRIEREKWVEQAKDFIAQGDTGGNSTPVDHSASPAD